jgi:hypothetical protein
MSIYMVAFRGGMPLGSLAGGYFATIIGAPPSSASTASYWFLLPPIFSSFAATGYEKPKRIESSSTYFGKFFVADRQLN